MAIILDGKKLAEEMLERLRKEIKKISPIRLAVVLVGNNPASLNFIKQKQKTAEKIGVSFKLYGFKENITEKKLIKELIKIVKDKANDGIVVQLPLPKHTDEQKILNIIPHKKDVDALSQDNQLVESPTASGIMELLKKYGIEVKGKRVIIIGKGKLVGKPLALIMKKAGTKLITCGQKTKNLASKTVKADILVSATGRLNLIKENMVKKGAVVIDAGFTRHKRRDGVYKIRGDVDFERVKEKASYITPVPGGVGPMTIAMLFTNLVKLVRIKNKTT